MDAEVRWNFTKFLLDEEGKLIATFPSNMTPLDDKILQWFQS
jgi:glutathione peroxidase